MIYIRILSISVGPQLLVARSTFLQIRMNRAIFRNRPRPNSPPFGSEKRKETGGLVQASASWESLKWVKSNERRGHGRLGQTLLRSIPVNSLCGSKMGVKD